jgi:PHD/YefM family antitoxin component YafN of YafNO toxin-antitoxin module
MEAKMTLSENLLSAQFVTVKDKRFVLIPAEDWEALIEWLEDIEDSRIVKESLDQLKATSGDRQRAGWLKWDDVASDL